jgi:hypothetical protein
MYWAYKLWHDPTGSTQEGLFRNDSKLSSVKVAKLDALSHPYPQEIAGTPTGMSWDATGRRLTFSYHPRRATGRTVVFVPHHTYPHGYTVVVNGGRVRSGAGTQHLTIVAGRHSRVVTVTVRRRAP